MTTLTAANLHVAFAPNQCVPDVTVKLTNKTEKILPEKITKTRDSIPRELAPSKTAHKKKIVRKQVE